MMNRFSWKLEVALAGLLIVVLMIFVLPSFFRAQARGDEKRIQDQLQMVLRALQDYIVDHRQAPPIYYHPLTGRSSVVSLGSGQDFFYEPVTENEIQILMSPLLQGNYLKSIPPILEEFKEYENRYIGVTIHHLYLRKTDTRKEETLNWGIAVGWPHANREKGQWIEITPQTYPSPAIDFEDFNPDFGYKKLDEMYLQAPKDKKIKSEISRKRSSVIPDFTVPLIDPKSCYHPSNGIESAGAVYTDLKGKRIP